MAFKIPTIPRLKQPLKQTSNLQSECRDLPSTNIDELKLAKTIGNGNFGKVSLYHKGNGYVIMKEMTGDGEEHERLFVKEAKLLSSIKHPNIVQFEGIVASEETSAFLMEYVYFDFSAFGYQQKIHNLSQLVKHLDANDYEGFEHFQLIIAEDICKGLKFLHEHDIVHRDLKPDNVLVSNQHCLGKQGLDKFWLQKPVMAKLSDFGESRSLLVQTNSLIHTKTENVNRGTPAYMAPEIHLDNTKTNTLEELKSMDVWSMAMLFYMLLNPNARYPYEEEVKTALKSGVAVKVIMAYILKFGNLPSFNPKYEEKRDSAWISLVDIYQKTAKFDISLRPSVAVVQQYFHEGRKQVTTDLLTGEYVTETNAARQEVQQTNRQDNGMDDGNTRNRYESVGAFQTRNIFDALNKIKPTQTAVSASTSDKSGHPADIPPSTVTPTTEVDGSSFETSESAANGSMKARFGLNDLSAFSSPLSRDHACSEENQRNRFSAAADCAGNRYVQTERLQSKSSSSHLTDSIHSLPDIFVEEDKGVSKRNLWTKHSDISDRIFQRLDFDPVTKGDFHQASPDVFHHAAVGTQCSSICLVSLIVAVYKNPYSWTTNDINDIVRAGDKLHLDILREKGWPYERTEGKLDADELPREVEILFQEICLKASTGVTNNLICCLAKDVRGRLQHVFENKTRALLLCRTGDKCRSIIFQNYLFSLFDPHSCNDQGDICPEGTAGVFHFDDLDDLIIKLLKLFTEEDENKQVDFYICDIEILSEVLILGDSLDTEKTVAYKLNEYQFSKNKKSHLTYDQDRFEIPCTYSSGSSDGEANFSDRAAGEQLYKERKTGLSLEEILSICVFQHHDENKICTKTPLPRSNSIFVIDIEKVNVKDLTCDDSGTYDTHASPSVLVKAIVSKGKLSGTHIITRVKKNMTQDLQREESNFLIKRKYSIKADAGDGKQERIISLVSKNESLVRYAVVQYLGNWSIRLRPHKNSKSGNVYIRTKPSIMDKSRNLSENRSAKEVINLIESEGENLMTDATLGDLPQNRQQIYNIKKKLPTAAKSRNTGPVRTADFQKLILSMDTQTFLRDLDFSFREGKGKIAPNTFAATTNTLNMIKLYCTTTSHHKAQLAIDMTYKVGPFYTTCLSMAHPAFVYKNHRSRHPTIFVGMMTSSTRTIQDYTYLSTQLKKHGIKNLIYGTDGEVALERGFEDVYPIEERNIHLRCFNHVKDDLKAQLKQMKLENQEKIIDDILGHEHQSVRVNGLVDSEHHEFERHYQTLSKEWPQQFKHYFELKGMKTRSLKDTLLKCMGREVRIAAGLGNPPNKYENQRAESINIVLKEAVGGFVDQARVHDVVYSKVVLPQERECLKAFSCQGEYRLSEDFKHLEVQPSKWLTMTPEQRQQHVKKLLSPSTLEFDNRAVTRKLSVQPEECLQFIQNIPRSLIDDIWEQAERLISHAKINDIDDNSTCIIYDKKVHVVRRNESKFECSCDFFHKVSICSHVLVMADNTCSVFDFLKHRTYDPSKAIRRHMSPSSGEKRVKKPRRGKQNIFKLPIETEITRSFSSTGTDAVNLNKQRVFQYTEIWHNDEPFVLEYVHTVERSNEHLTCMSCHCTISKMALEPYDIVLTHKERYKYPAKENGRTIMKCTFKRLAKRFYCLKRDCVLSRHPYFWNGLINQGQVKLKDSHKKLLGEVFGFV